MIANFLPLERKAEIMVSHLEKQARLLQSLGYDNTYVVHWLNDILPILRRMHYRPSEEDYTDLQSHWEEFFLIFYDDILV